MTDQQLKALLDAIGETNRLLTAMDGRIYNLNRRMVVGLNQGRSAARRWVVLLNLLRDADADQEEIAKLLAELVEDQDRVSDAIVGDD